MHLRVCQGLLYVAQVIKNKTKQPWKSSTKQTYNEATCQSQWVLHLPPLKNLISLVTLGPHPPPAPYLLLRAWQDELLSKPFRNRW